MKKENKELSEKAKEKLRLKELKKKEELDAIEKHRVFMIVNSRK